MPRTTLSVGQRVAAASLASLLALGSLSACAEDTEQGGSGGSSTTTTDSGTTQVQVKISDGTVTPNGERVEAEVGEPIEFVVEADEAGELHVHSTPEQQLAYDEGTTTVELTIDQPGVVEVETHDPEIVVVQLEVR